MNTLLNIDTAFGEYEGHVMPLIITIAIAATPILVWLFLLQGTPIRFWYVLVFDVLLTARMALKILGKENEKLKFWRQQRADEYRSADELVHVKQLHEDGLIEYDTGKVAYIIVGYPKAYLTDDKLSVEMEKFMNELDMWNWDCSLYNTVDEILLSDDLPLLKRYTDKEVISERIDFYDYQDEWSRTHTGLYSYVFLVQAQKYDWKRMKNHLEELVSSELSSAFNSLRICNYDECCELFNRDVCAYIDINKMLTKKYDNDQFFGSEVLWHDDDIPDNLIPEADRSDMENRRS